MDALDAIRQEGDRFYDLAAEADLARPVPSCPDWTIADLVAHLGQVHWFWATIVERRLQEPDRAEADRPDAPAGRDELVAFGRRNLGLLLDALRGADDATPVWTWAHRHDVGFIRRHQVQEVAIHRWDLQLAAGAEPDPIDPEVAIDAIDEFLDISLPWSVHADQPLPGSVHLHCTGTEASGGEWFVHPDGRVEPIHAKGDVAVRGTPSDLLLALYRRLDPDRFEMFGDEELGRTFFERINVG